MAVATGGSLRLADSVGLIDLSTESQGSAAKSSVADDLGPPYEPPTDLSAEQLELRRRCTDLAKHQPNVAPYVFFPCERSGLTRDDCKWYVFDAGQDRYVPYTGPTARPMAQPGGAGPVLNCTWPDGQEL
jgi:hypothetical protein